MNRATSLILWCAILNPWYLDGSILVQGDDTVTPFVFSAPITTKVLNPITGILFVGLSNPTNSNFTLASATRPTFQGNARFQGIAGLLPSAVTIEFLTLTQQPGCNAILPFVILNSDPDSAQQISALFENGTSFVQTQNLNDATGASTSGIVQLASSTFYIYAAVRPNGNQNFGASGSGVALVNEQCEPTNPTTNTIVLTIKNATNGFNGNLAQVLDAMSPQLGTTPVTINPTESGNINVNKVAFFYDLVFDRLYVGLRLQTGTTPPQIGKAVVVGQTTSVGLALLPIVADSAISMQSLATDEIIVSRGVDAIDLRALNLRVMHASTGSSYLIVNGGQGATLNVGNLIYALPLVDDPTAPSIHGTLANKNAPLENFKFVTPAANPGDLPLGSDPAALVGTSPLPIDTATQISDMVVMGDTVYVSVDVAPSSVNDTGIFYSQALFDGDSTSGNAGKIIGWTPWTKRPAPFNAFPSVTLPGDVIPNGSVAFFDADLKTGNFWIIEGSTQRAVGYTSWTATGQPNDLISSINSALSNGCYSQVDLHQGVRGMLSTPEHDRYAVFGGTNKTVFTRISQAFSSAINSPQQLFTDFSDPQNSLLKSLPPQAGSVTVLEYSRRLASEGSTNYFFAGTSTGLYVFSNDGNGFNVNTLITLDQPPFLSGAWTKVPTISGAVIDIKTAGKQLYIVTFEPTSKNPMKSKLYSVPFAPTINAMFDSSAIAVIAESNTNPELQDTLLFTGIQIIDTGLLNTLSEPRQEQLILATNNGLFKSNASQTGGTDISDVTNQTDANWQLINSTEHGYFSGIAGIDSQTPHTTFPLQLNMVGSQIGDQSSVLQLNGNGNGPADTGHVAFVPTFFNAHTQTPPFQTLYPITSFFSDGSRRFFINQPVTRSIRHTALSVIPFDTTLWSVGAPIELAHPVLHTTSRFFWLAPIGMSGLVLAGTPSGVIGLQ